MSIAVALILAAAMFASCEVRQESPFEADFHRMDEVLARADEYVKVGPVLYAKSSRRTLRELTFRADSVWNSM